MCENITNWTAEGEGYGEDVQDDVNVGPLTIEDVVAYTAETEPSPEGVLGLFLLTLERGLTEEARVGLIASIESSLAETAFIKALFGDAEFIDV